MSNWNQTWKLDSNEDLDLDNGIYPGIQIWKIYTELDPVLDTGIYPGIQIWKQDFILDSRFHIDSGTCTVEVSSFQKKSGETLASISPVYWNSFNNTVNFEEYERFSKFQMSGSDIHKFLSDIKNNW